MAIHSFRLTYRLTLIETINAVCAEGRWMSTPCFIPTLPWTHALAEPDCPHHLLLVVIDRGHAVGWCRLFPPGCRHGQATASLGIGLLPRYRHQGLGTRLVHRSLAWARRAGLKRITLTTHVDNACAIHVFTKCGFSPDSRTGNGSLGMTCCLPATPRPYSAGNVLNISGHEGDSTCESIL